jgi:hypothetical protein
MRALRDGDLYFFIDEAGDPNFYNRRGKLIVGEDGCSSHLILGFVRLYDPAPIREEIIALRQKVLLEPEFQRFQSIARTDTAFHASKDAPPVRDMFFQLIPTLNFRAVLTVAQKDEKFFRKKCDSKTDRYYDGLISELMRNSLHRYTNNHICIAERGSRRRQRPLEAAVKLARDRYQEQFLAEARDTQINVTVQTPTGEPCLTIIDYVAWAVQRAYVTGEMTYYKMVEDKVALVREMAGRKTTYFCAKKPFEIRTR